VQATPWPESAEQLIDLQKALGALVVTQTAEAPWCLQDRPDPPIFGGCFATFAPDPVRPRSERAWAAAICWRAGPGRDVPRTDLPAYRRSDAQLRGVEFGPSGRKARDVLAQSVLARDVSAPYLPGLLALRSGPPQAAAVGSLGLTPDVVLVDATGLDHPRGAGLAVHLGWAIGLPTVGVTDRPLVGEGEPPAPTRGSVSVVTVAGRKVGYRVTTRSGARPVLAHAGWRTSPETAAEAVLVASTEAARTPVPLQEARRVAREARDAHASWSA
jgi:deoxyinosine 3'endonuclease (endonuclease V)